MHTEIGMKSANFTQFPQYSKFNSFALQWQIHIDGNGNIFCNRTAHVDLLVQEF